MPSSRPEVGVGVEGLIARYRSALEALADDDLDEVRRVLAGAERAVQLLVDGPAPAGPVEGLPELLSVQAELGVALVRRQDEVARAQQELGKARRLIEAGRPRRTGRLLDSRG
ncbi:MAG: hypothetical protein R3F30_10415 [Planctomycetota bacterium]